jgi:photosystem II stability/assembly factor-like uncharacterized protein
MPIRTIWALLLCVVSIQGYAQKISSPTLGDISARNIGPAVMSGRVTAIEGSNQRPNLVYVGTAGGGVWKTENGGVSFKPIFDKYCQSIGALAVDQAHPDTIWVGTGESNMRNTVSIGNGVYRSKDGGENWTFMGLPNTEHISKIVLHPTNPNVVYVAVPGALWSDSDDRGVYKTEDGGQTWSKIYFVNNRTGCADLIMDPRDPNTLICTMWEFRRKPFAFASGGPSSGIYKSTDGGKTWKPIRNGLPQGDLGRMAVAQAPSKPDRLIMICEAKETALYLSEDAGMTWKEKSSTFNVKARPFYFSTIVFDPKNPDRVYRPAFNMSISDDGGYSFYDAPGGGVHADHHALWINPNNTDHMYLGTDGGVYMSVNKGNNWSFVRDLPISQFYHINADNNKPFYRVYGGLQDNGSWMAPSQSAGGVENSDWVSLFGGDGFWVIPDPTDPNYCYAEYQGGNMFRVNIATNTSKSIKPYELKGDDKYRWHWNTLLYPSPNKVGSLYTASQYLFRTDDKGKSWVKMSGDLTTNDKAKQNQEESGGLSADNTSAENHCIIYCMDESPLDQKILWVGTDDGQLQMTTDEGKTWSNVSKNYAVAGIPANTWVSSIDASKHDKNVVFATFDNHTYGDHKTYAAMSKDMGKTWTKFESKELTGFANKIVQDTKNPNILYLGTEMGLFLSFDMGANWVRYKANFPWYAMVRDIFIQEEKGDVLVATHGRGIYILDDISTLRDLATIDLTKPLVFLDSRPAVSTNGLLGGNQVFNAGEYVGGNYTDAVIIPYYLKDRANSDNMKVIIKDAQGNVLRELDGGKAKGVNKVAWDMRMKPPKGPEGGTKLSFGGFSGPLVLPGKYSASIQLGDQIYEHNFEVNANTNSDYTQVEQKKQFETAMQLYKQYEDLGKTMEKIVSSQKQIDALLANKSINKKLKDQLTLYRDSLENIRKFIVPTKQSSIFADEERLRERIAEVYGAVLSYEGEPNNTIYQKIDVLNTEIKQTQDRFSKNKSQHFDKINKQLIAAKLPPLPDTDVESAKP